MNNIPQAYCQYLSKRNANSEKVILLLDITNQLRKITHKLLEEVVISPNTIIIKNLMSGFHI